MQGDAKSYPLPNNQEFVLKSALIAKLKIDFESNLKV